MNHPQKHCAGPITRRSILEVGSLGIGGLAFADFLRLKAEAGTVGKADPDTSVILFWLPGGFSHMDTYDMKPDAPSEYRGELRPVSTNVPGIEVCEHFPRHAKCAHRYSFIRSISHTFAEHDGGHKLLMTGRNPKKPVGFVNDAPAGASIVTKMREHINRGLPHNVLMNDPGRTVADYYSLGAAYLGPAYVPFTVPGNPNDPKFTVPNLALSNEMAARLDDRRTLLEGLDRLRRDLDRSGAMQAMDKYNQKAYEMLLNDKARNAFDLSQEDPKTRERYGHHSWGHRALLARRLVEAGSSFVTAVLEDPVGGAEKPPGVNYNWDCHAVNCHMFNDFRWRAPYYDQTLTALIDDVYERGLDKKVLIVAMGEFGHTPRINYTVGNSTGVIQPGRDHWPKAMSLLVSGGGLRMGQVVGSTTAKGETPKDRPLNPNDLWATIYRHLGIDTTHAFLDHSGRPMPILPFGEPIHELL